MLFGILSITFFIQRWYSSLCFHLVLFTIKQYNTEKMLLWKFKFWIFVTILYARTAKMWDNMIKKNHVVGNVWSVVVSMFWWHVKCCNEYILVKCRVKWVCFSEVCSFVVSMCSEMFLVKCSDIFLAKYSDMF